MSTLSEMPVVTVEQVTRFREAAIAVEQQRDDLVAFARDFRDNVLHQRYNLADNGMTSDQINDVLNLFDDTLGDAIANARGQQS